MPIDPSILAQISQQMRANPPMAPQGNTTLPQLNPNQLGVGQLPTGIPSGPAIPGNNLGLGQGGPPPGLAQSGLNPAIIQQILNMLASQGNR